MSNTDPPKLDTSKLPLNPVIQAAEQSISGLLTAAIQAMSKDATALVDKNGGCNPPFYTKMKSLTADMISLLGARLNAIFPKAETKPSESAPPSDTEHL